MKTYLQMDGDKLVEYVEKREYDLLASETADLGVLADQLANERDAIKAEIESMHADINLALIMIEKMKTTIRK